MTRGIWVSAAAALSLTLADPQIADLPTPEAQFGFRMGAEGQLASADAIEEYFEVIASGSDRVDITSIGPTTEGRRMIAAIVSSADNIKNLEAIRQTNARLADPRGLSPDEARRLATAHKAVLVVGCGADSKEVAATQAASELLHMLATSTDPAILRVLNNVVIIIVPTLNPDGHRLVVDWTHRTKRAPSERAPMPWQAHKYAGDVTSDALMMNLVENRNLSRFLHTQWHPQVFLSMHEVASDGARFFVSSNGDTSSPNYDPLIWRESALLGGAMALELERDQRQGVISRSTTDDCWPGPEGARLLGRNTVCLIAEAAQANDSWTLRDIVDYDLSAIEGVLHAVAAFREQLIHGFHEMGRRAVEAGGRGAPFAFIIPSDQRDPRAAARIEEILLHGQIEIYRALEPFRADGEPYPAETDVILLAQPYRAYVRTLLESESASSLPALMGVEVKTIERSFEPPAMSRITTASVPEGTVWGDPRPSYYVIGARGSDGAIAANRLVSAGVAAAWATSPLDAGGFRHDTGALVVPYTKAAQSIVPMIAKELGLRVDGFRGKLPPATRPLLRARTAIYKPWIENADEGWTRWVLEQYEFPFSSISNADVRAGNLRMKFDAIILPSATTNQLMDGHDSGVVPPEYAGGLGPEGVNALDAFVRGGGTIVALDKAGRFALEVFRIPLRDVAGDVTPPAAGPGSILRLEVNVSHALGFGVSPNASAFFSSSSAYEPTDASSGAAAGDATKSAIQTVARYAEGDLLVSGSREAEKAIASRAAVVSAAVGLGRVILIGFPAQHRGQSHATFRFLFNSLLTLEKR